MKACRVKLYGVIVLFLMPVVQFAARLPNARKTNKHLVRIEKDSEIVSVISPELYEKIGKLLADELSNVSHNTRSTTKLARTVQELIQEHGSKKGACLTLSFDIEHQE